MNHYLNSILVLNAFFILQHARAEKVEKTTPLVTVESVDLDRYMGTWYEIARLPNKFQKICEGEVTATYKLQKDGTILVVNRCLDLEGQFTEAEGVAKLAIK